MDEGVLTGKGNIDANPGLDEYLAMEVEPGKRDFEFMEPVGIERIAPRQIAEIHESGHTFHHFGWNVAGDSCDVNLGS